MARASAYPPVFFGELPDDADIIELGGEDGAHAVRVRRIRTGEAIRIADGNGCYADCEVIELAQRSLRAQVIARGTEVERLPRLIVVQALAKGDRGTLAVEMLTEIGVDEIIPWQATHSVAKWDGKEDKSRARWAQVAREAAKQSRRARIPRIGPVVHAAAVADLCGDAQSIVLHESATEPITALNLDRGGSDVVLVVGPEGGVSPDELDALRAAGASIIRLGPEVLRTSTAGLVGATWASVALNRWAG
ncbi:16S rRNA (uracil(1498)-N(3))-methyltransferase [Cumulibacter soli]|uniref:16S rRNA (uracil(1498)-N(3))-methyltransferase n=1 Tax=Cumulibacter soli TaxID=2546344 RepID=UPI001067E85A|nr:16S rRNA (uracil(1498)-N(3))-methyltransferase [Cumulibacter soli]